MNYLEYVLWAYFILNPVYIYLTYEKDKQKLLADPTKKVALYYSTIIHLWLPTSLLLSLLYNKTFDWSDVGLVVHWDLMNQIMTAALMMVIAYFYVSIKKLKNDRDLRQLFLKQMESLAYIMPTQPKELKIFTFGISVTAGICEELLFRGYLLYLFESYMPIYLAVIVSSLLFGLGHIYQGIAKVLQTAFYGLVLAGVYWLTDSILLPILIHIATDVYAGLASYNASESEKQSNV